MKEVETDLETLKSNWTPKQRTNWENHGEPLFERFDDVAELAEESGTDFDVEAAKEWYLRTYRPKKRGDGMMERDHVQIGEPEHYYKKFVGKLNSPWGSIQGLMMAQFGLSEERMEEVEEAATALVIARALGSKVKRADLARKLQEHKKVGALYGVDS